LRRKTRALVEDAFAGLIQEPPMKSTLTSLAAASVIVATVLSAPPSATAAYRDVSGGAACKGANGAASASFTYSNNYLTNIGSTPQYIICNFQMDDASFVPAPTESLILHAYNTQAVSRTLSCSAQTGGYYYGSNYVASNSVKAHTFASVGSDYLTWTPSLLVRNYPYDVLTINCRLDPGIRVGLIQYRG
jgi:hypothetical protein